VAAATDTAADTASHDAGNEESGRVDSGPSQDAGAQPTITAQAAPAGKGLPAFAKVQDTAGAFPEPADLKGKWTVIWFYPAAQTFG